MWVCWGAGGEAGQSVCVCVCVGVCVCTETKDACVCARACACSQGKLGVTRAGTKEQLALAAAEGGRESIAGQVCFFMLFMHTKTAL